MGLFGLIGTGAAITAAVDSDDPHVKNFANYFKGSQTITLGGAHTGVYGHREDHIYTDDTKLVVSGGWLGLKAFAGAATSVGSILDNLRPGGNTTFSYGVLNELVYGGPRVRILRGNSITKVSSMPLAESGYAGVMGSPASAWKWPEDNNWLFPTDTKAKEIVAQDGSTATGILALSVLLTISTAALELALRFAYPECGPVSRKYAAKSPEDRNKEEEIPRGAEGGEFGVSLAAKMAPSLIMGIIYGVEMAGSFSEWVSAQKENTSEKLETAVTILTVPYWLPKSLIESSGLTCKQLLLLVVTVLAILATVAVLVVVAVVK